MVEVSGIKGRSSFSRWVHQYKNGQLDCGEKERTQNGEEEERTQTHGELMDMIL